MPIRTFVIGDVHGCALTLQSLLFDNLKITRSDHIVFLGDIIDRGPAIKETLDLILNLIDDGFRMESVLGNHEDMLLNAFSSIEVLETWLLNRGKTTLQSFDVPTIWEIDSKYLDFLKTMPYYKIIDNYIIVHAGLNLSIPEPFTDKIAMLWSRMKSTDKTLINNRKVIIGHTPTSLEVIRKSANQDLIFLDGGCVYIDNPQFGNLCAIELGCMELFVERNKENYKIEESNS